MCNVIVSIVQHVLVEKFVAFQQAEAKKKAWLKQQIKEKTIELGDNLRDNLALDSIAKASIIDALRELESTILVLLDRGTDDFVCIEKKQLQERLDIALKNRVEWQQELAPTVPKTDHIELLNFYIEFLEKLLGKKEGE